MLLINSLNNVLLCARWGAPEGGLEPAQELLQPALQGGSQPRGWQDHGRHQVCWILRRSPPYKAYKVRVMVATRFIGSRDSPPHKVEVSAAAGKGHGRHQVCWIYREITA
jgi:hypothetical protein